MPAKAEKIRRGSSEWPGTHPRRHHGDSGAEIEVQDLPVPQLADPVQKRKQAT